MTFRVSLPVKGEKKKKRTHTNKTKQANKQTKPIPFSFPFFSPRCHRQPEICQPKSVSQSWHSITCTREAARCRFHGQLHSWLLIVLRIGYTSITSLKGLQGEFNNFGWAPLVLQYKISGDDEANPFSQSILKTWQKEQLCGIKTSKIFSIHFLFNCWLLTDSQKE